MTTTTKASTNASTEATFDELPTGPIWALRDSWTEATRHLRAVPRNPELVLFATIQPVMFVLLFNYVFGGSIKIPGVPYVQYLIPGVFAQTVVFGSSFTSVGLAKDLEEGFIDRLRTLPISQSAVLIGRTVSDLVRNAFTYIAMLGVAFLIGFRFEGGVINGIWATLLLLVFAYAFSWIQALIGLSVGSVEAANSAGFVWMFPMTFLSSAFVDTASMPRPLQIVAEANPFTKCTNAARALFNGQPAADDVIMALCWAAGLIVVFATLSIRKFSRAVG